VSDTGGQEVKKTSVADDESKRWRGGKGEQVRIDERVNAAYAYILDGGTRRQIAERLASRFNTSIRTSHDDYAKAMILLREEQSATREDLLNQIQALRLATVAAPEQLATNTPTLNITVESKRPE